MTRPEKRRKQKVLFVFGTRPEAIKLAPVLLAMRRHGGFNVRVCVTAQHREMLEQVLGFFKIRPHYNLSIMKKDQGLPEITASGLLALQPVMKKESPDMVVVQGDTTSTFVGSLAAFYLQVPVAHVEAGLRTGHRYSPFPEEINRRLTSVIAELHFAPTTVARDNLIGEGVSKARITVTGNTAVDALLLARDKIQKSGHRAFKAGFPFLSDGQKRMILVTGHRRESFGQGFKNICSGLKDIARKHPGVCIVYPVHLNPNVRGPVMSTLGGFENIHLIEPQPYGLFVSLMMRSFLILTDSGGIQEEAPSLGKPVLVMRDVTERTEAVQAGTARLVGARKDPIARAVDELLTDPKAYAAMKRRGNPFGDGRASEKIVRAVGNYLSQHNA